MRGKIAYLFCLPALFLIFGVAFYPILNTLWLSFYSFNLKFNQKSFIGLKNYLLVFSDQRAWCALSQTIIFTSVSVLAEFILGLLLAMLLHQAIKPKGFLRASSLLPWATPTVVSGLLWRWIFNDQYGILNMFGDLLSKPTGAMIAIIIADVWKTTPFVAILLLAGLQLIPIELYEASKIDGATKLKQFIYITLPLLKPIIIVTLLFRTLDAFRIFDLIYVMTGGGPGNSTETISIYTYKTLFSYLAFGKGSCMAVIMFLCVALISVVYLYFLRRAEY
jgi:multiple sugar transport system permease protein